MNTQQLIKFFASRPSLTKLGVCREAGISDTLLDRIMLRGGTLTERVKRKLAPVLNKYGGAFNHCSYVLLEEGDTIKEGDEGLVNANCWLPVSNLSIGSIFRAHNFYPHRRKV